MIYLWCEFQILLVMKIKDFLFNLICEYYTVEKVLDTCFHAKKNDRKYEITTYRDGSPHDKWRIVQVDKFSSTGNCISDPIPIEQFDARNFDY